MDDVNCVVEFSVTQFVKYGFALSFGWILMKLLFEIACEFLNICFLLSQISRRIIMTKLQTQETPNEKDPLRVAG